MYNRMQSVIKHSMTEVFKTYRRKGLILRYSGSGRAKVRDLFQVVAWPET